jgi:HEAT repeat protein
MIWDFPNMIDLGAEESHTRERAAEVLGKVGDRRAVLPLIAALEDADKRVRLAIVKSLGRLGDRQADGPLQRARKEAHAQRRFDETRAISKALTDLEAPSTDDPLLSGLKDLDFAVCQRALVALGHSWKLPVVAELASDAPETRRRAARKLGKSQDERAEVALLAVLKDPDQLVRWEATRALSNLWKSRPWFSELVGLLADRDAQTRASAAWGLRSYRDERVVQLLISALWDQDYSVKEMASESLGELGQIAIEPLASLLSSDNREILRAAGKALSKSNDEKVVSILASAIRNHRWSVRQVAFDSLVELGDRGISTLEMALCDDDPEVRRLAYVALRRIGTIRAQAALRYVSTQNDDDYEGK